MNMAIEERGGYKVDLQAIKIMAVETCLFIESWSKDGKGEKAYSSESTHIKRPARSAHTKGVKAKAFQRLAKKIKNELFDDKRKKKANKIALTTYTAYLGDVREAIQLETNLKSPTLFQDMQELKKKYPLFSKSFNAISRASAKNIKEIRKRELMVIQVSDAVIADKAYGELIKTNIHHPLIALLSPTERQSSVRKAKIAENRKMRKNNAVTISYANIEYVTKQCLKSDDFYELAIGVALATGRRAIEVIHTGIFKKSRLPHDLSFCGVAKKFGLKAAQEKHIIPTLFDSEIITDAVNKLRSTERYAGLIDDVGELSLKQQNVVINRRTAGGLNRAVRSLFNTDELVFKDTRTIAGNVAVEKIAHQERYANLDSGAFRTMYFIHQTYEEAVNYERVKIDFKSKFKPVVKKEVKKAKGAILISNPDVSPFNEITNDLEFIEQKGMRVVIKLHNKLIAKLSKYGGFFLSVSSIYKGKKNGDELVRIGSNRIVVKRYMELPIVIEAVKKYHEINGLEK